MISKDFIFWVRPELTVIYDAGNRPRSQMNFGLGCSFALGTYMMNLSRTGVMTLKDRVSSAVLTRNRCDVVRTEPDGSNRRIASRMGPSARKGLNKLISRSC